jgi:hypothetical protein
MKPGDKIRLNEVGQRLYAHRLPVGSVGEIVDFDKSNHGVRNPLYSVRFDAEPETIYALFEGEVEKVK